MQNTSKQSTSLRVLLVEDNADIAMNICESFEHAGHIVDYANSAEMAMALLPSATLDLLIIDIMLPGMDGIELCSHIRANKLSSLPILVLTARNIVEDKLAAFDAGADDYLTKPFSTRELLARSAVLSRRKLLHDNATLVVGPISLDINTRTITRQGKIIEVGKIGYQITYELLKASPGIVLRDDLEHALWGDERPDSDALRTHMSVLRKNLDKPFNTQMIQTVHGAGWKLILPESGSN